MPILWRNLTFWNQVQRTYSAICLEEAVEEDVEEALEVSSKAFQSCCHQDLFEYVDLQKLHHLEIQLNENELEFYGS